MFSQRIFPFDSKESPGENKGIPGIHGDGPLAVEQDGHLPRKTFHFSTSPSARYAYLMGADERGQSAVHVWDLFNGTRHKYHVHNLVDFLDDCSIRHLYEMNDNKGLAVTYNEQNSGRRTVIITVYHCTIIHYNETVHGEGVIILTKQIDGYVMSTREKTFWSTCRSEKGILLVTSTTHGMACTEFCSSGIGVLRTFTHSPKSIKFRGQPWSSRDGCLNFFEAGQETLTGRIVEFNMDSNTITYSTPDWGPVGGQPPIEAKQVARGDKLWMLLEKETLVTPEELEDELLFHSTQHFPVDEEQFRNLVQRHARQREIIHELNLNINGNRDILGPMARWILAQRRRINEVEDNAREPLGTLGNDRVRFHSHGLVGNTLGRDTPESVPLVRVNTILTCLDQNSGKWRTIRQLPRVMSEVTLDITNQGEVIMLERDMLQGSIPKLAQFTRLTGSPPTLLKLSSLATVNYFPKIRSDQEFRKLGILLTNS